MRIIVATTSTYKIKALSNLGIDFEFVDSKVDEKDFERGSDPVEHVLYLAQRKAKAVASLHQGSVVIGMDSIAFFNDTILEKPTSIEEAKQRLKTLSGKQHVALSGICVVTEKGEIIKETAQTKVTFRPITLKEIDYYITTDSDIYNICLGYDPELQYSSSFIQSIEGSFHNILSGVPLEIIAKLLLKYHPLKK